MQSMAEGYPKFLHQVTHYVYTNWNQKFQMKGASEKKSFREYYASTSWKVEYFYVMIFLMRQQQWSQEQDKIFRDECFTAWEQAGKPEMTEEVLIEFEEVLVTADEWIGHIISKEPGESSAKKTKKVDRSKMKLYDVLTENNFMNFQQFSAGIFNLCTHFKAFYAIDRGGNETEKQRWLSELSKKPLTMKLYPRVKGCSICRISGSNNGTQTKIYNGSIGFCVESRIFQTKRVTNKLGIRTCILRAQ